MKRSPLKRKTPLKTKTPLRSRSSIGLEGSKSALIRAKTKKTSKVSSGTKKSKIGQKQCDKLLTPLIKAKHPYCLLCGSPTQVAHHHIHKSKSLNLRYDMDNLINLCNSCHFKLHLDEGYWSGRIRDIKGEEWWAVLMKKRDVIVRYMDYEEMYQKLKNAN